MYAVQLGKWCAIMWYQPLIQLKTISVPNLKGVGL